MLFSNTKIPESNFTIKGRTVPITNSYNHLGVTFAVILNGIYRKYVSSIYKHQHVFVLPKLKYKLYRKNSEKLYLD